MFFGTWLLNNIFRGPQEIPDFLAVFLFVFSQFRTANVRGGTMGTEVMDAVVAEQQKTYCDLLEQWAFSDLNIHYAAIGLSIDPRNHPYGDAILFGWLVLHGGLHNLLNNFPALKHYYAQQHVIPLTTKAYVLVQVFIAYRHLGGGSETNGGSADEGVRQKRELEYHLRHSHWFSQRFCQVISEN